MSPGTLPISHLSSSSSKLGICLCIYLQAYVRAFFYSFNSSFQFQEVRVINFWVLIDRNRWHLRSVFQEWNWPFSLRKSTKKAIYEYLEYHSLIRSKSWQLFVIRTEEKSYLKPISSLHLAPSRFKPCLKIPFLSAGGCNSERSSSGTRQPWRQRPRQIQISKTTPSLSEHLLLLSQESRRRSLLSQISQV